MTSAPEPLHPFRIALRGGSATARAELGDRLARALAPHVAVGRLGPASPTPGGDEGPAYATATTRADGSLATLKRGAGGAFFDRHYALLDCDLVLVDGPAGDAAPVVRLLDEGAPLETPPARPLATVGRGAPPDAGVPHHAPEDAAGLADRVRAHLAAAAARAPLYGLVLAGGASRRMGREKWALDYRGEPHARSLHRLLSRFCERTFLSVRPDQRGREGLDDLPHLADTILGRGPVGGILSAMSAHPDAAWIVLACDLPFVDAGTIERLLAARAPLRFATTYVSPHDGMPEPLCAIYEPKARLRLAQVAGLGHACPRKLLMNAPVRTIAATRPDELTNANHPHEYERARARLRAGGPA